MKIDSSQSMMSGRITSREQVGRELREQRRFRRLSQRELAERAGTTQTHIARIEAGLANPTLALLERITGAMKLDLIFALRRKLGD